MMNYNKTGYSTKEVAQILGCIPQTVINRIDNGELEALVDGKQQPGKRRKIRVTREQLTSYIRTHRGYYEKETVKAFLKACQVDIKPKEEPSEASETSEVHDIKELTGAWAGLVGNSVDTEPPKNETHQLLVDGRIMVCNVEKKTIKAILDALLEDSQFQAKTIEIKLGKE